MVKRMRRMKQMKRMLPLLFVLLLLCSAALAENAQVIDDAGLFSAEEIQRMTEIIDRVEKAHQVDLVVLTTRDTPYDPSDSLWRVRDFADDYYDDGGYGMGEDDSGMLLLLDMNNRAMWLSTGGVMIDYINDDREEDILDHAYDKLREGDYGGAMITALNRVAHFMDEGRKEGFFRYDEATGKRIGGIYNALTPMETAVAAVAGLAVAAAVYLSVSARYSLKGSTYSYDRAANTAVTFTRDDHVFVRKFVEHTRIDAGGNGHGGRLGGGHSGGSGVHTSHGGVSHGGGGRRF